MTLVFPQRPVSAPLGFRTRGVVVSDVAQGAAAEAAGLVNGAVVAGALTPRHFPRDGAGFVVS
eukprot:gene39923-30812_t